jgi:hypothetical protein
MQLQLLLPLVQFQWLRELLINGKRMPVVLQPGRLLLRRLLLVQLQLVRGRPDIRRVYVLRRVKIHRWPGDRILARVI